MITLKQKLFLTVTIVLGLVILAIIFGILPVISQVKVTSHNLAFKKSTLALIDTQLESLNDFQNKKSDYNQALAQIDDIFIDNSAPVSFIEFLEAQARITGLELLIQPLSVSDEKISTAPIGFQLVLEGRFNKGLLFLERIEQSHWLFEISQISVSRFSEKEIESLKNTEHLNAGDVSLRINIKTISR